MCTYMTEYQQTLVVRNMDLVDWVIRHRVKVTNMPLLSYEDFYQIGCEALCRAAIAYKQTIGEFAPFASRYIYNAMIDHCRKENYRARSSVDQDVDYDSSPLSLAMVGCHGNFDSDIYNDQLCLALKNSKTRYSGVTRQGIEALEMKLLGFTSSEIAKRYGTSVNNVNAWISRARSKLKEDAIFLAAFG